MYSPPTVRLPTLAAEVLVTMGDSDHDVQQVHGGTLPCSSMFLQRVRAVTLMMHAPSQYAAGIACFLPKPNRKTSKHCVGGA